MIETTMLSMWCSPLTITSIFGHCTEMRFACFFSGGFITAIVVNPPERKLKKRTSVNWFGE